MADHSRTINTTINKYVRGETVTIFRKRKLMAMVNSRGRMSFNNSGLELEWKLRYKQSPLTGYEDMDTLTFARNDRWTSAVLPYRGYVKTDAMTVVEKLKNRGDPAIVKYWSDLSKIMMSEFKEQIPEEFYTDGNATGKSKNWHGIDSFCSVSGANSSAPIGINNDTYAGLSTALAAKGGSWSGTWPEGTGDAHYDYWTPLVVDYTSANAGAAGWGASTKTWPNTCLEALRFGIIHGQNSKRGGKMDVILTTKALYRQFLDKLQAEEQINVSRGEGSSGLYKLGFTDITNFDGTDVTWEYGPPETTAFGWCLDDLEIMCMEDELIKVVGPDFDMATQSDRFAMRMLGNLRFESIRGFVKWDNVS